MDYKKIKEEIGLITIGDTSKGVPDGYLLKLSHNIWDEDECKKLLEKFEEFGHSLQDNPEINEDIRDILMDLNSVAVETAAYLASHQMEEKLSEFIDTIENLI